jgi:DNA-binding transcriptional LysR family regulator
MALPLPHPIQQKGLGMNLRSLNYFTTVADAGSFTKAAKKLYVSQSTLSKAVSALENELHTPLYKHGSKRFELTPSGEALYDFSRDVLGYYAEKEKALLAKLSATDNKLNLALPPTAGSMYFYSKMGEYRQKYPDIELTITDITSRYIPDLLLRGETDLGVVIEPFDDPQFNKTIVYQSEATLIVSKEHPLANADQVDFRTLKDERFLQVTEDFQFYSVFEMYCERAGFRPNVVFKINQWDLIMSMVENNEGVSILPKPLVDKYLGKRAHTVHLVNPEFPWALSVIYPKSSVVTRPMQHFLEFFG